MEHGGDLGAAVRRHGGAPEDWLDLSTGISPWPWPVSTLPAAVWQRLPDAAAMATLLDAARRAYLVPPGLGLVAAPGTQALIQWLPRLVAAGRCAVLGPTYGEHAAAWRAAGHAVAEVASFDPVPSDLLYGVTVEPNNPDGRRTPRDRLEAWAAGLRARGGCLVIDAAFADADPAEEPIADAVTLRSFGKFYGLAGLRLGFAIGAAAPMDRLEAALGPWAVSGPALAIGAAALADSAWAGAQRARLHRQAGRLDAVLAGAGCPVLGGTAQFRLVRRADAAAVHEALAARRIWVRRFEARPDLLRFGLPNAAGLARLSAALDSATPRKAATA
jgi:cobalamin biosynthetic protein CobC